MERKCFCRLLAFTLVFFVMSEVILHMKVSPFLLVGKSAKRVKPFDNTQTTALSSSSMAKIKYSTAEPLQLKDDARVTKDPKHQRKVLVHTREQQDVAAPSTFRQINNGSFVYSAYFDDRLNMSAVVRLFGVSDLATMDDPPTCTVRFSDNSYHVIQSQVERLEGRKWLR